MRSLLTSSRLNPHNYTSQGAAFPVQLTLESKTVTPVSLFRQG
jgi:hypothetical protein